MRDVYRAVWLMALAGCYSPNFANCQIQCTDSCPNSLQCDSDLHVCRSPGTSCSGDGGLKGDATSGSGSGSSTPMCTLESTDELSASGPGLTLDLDPKIPAGHFIVVSVSENAGSALMPTQISDQNGHNFNVALSTATGSNTYTVGIYYMLAMQQVDTVESSWTFDVTQAVAVDDWACSTPPMTVLGTNDANPDSTGSATDTGSLTLDQEALVVAAIATPYLPPLTLETPGFTPNTTDGYSDPSGFTASYAGGWEMAGSGNVDASFATQAGLPAVAGIVAFGFPMLTP